MAWNRLVFAVICVLLVFPLSGAAFLIDAHHEHHADDHGCTVCHLATTTALTPALSLNLQAPAANSGRVPTPRATRVKSAEVNRHGERAPPHLP